MKEKGGYSYSASSFLQLTNTGHNSQSEETYRRRKQTEESDHSQGHAIGARGTNDVYNCGNYGHFNES